MYRKVAVLVSYLLLLLPARPSLAVSTTNLNSTTPLALAQTLAGPGITVSNVTFTGANVAGGSFTGGIADGIGIASGVILSSGNIASAAGPNLADDTTTDNGTAGDADLNVIVAPQTTHDAAVLQFDFVPTSSTVNFRYVFGSEEYNEFVGSQFNDVFAFYIDGVNVALLPGTSTAVAINTVNLTTNSSFYHNNEPSSLGIPTPFGTSFDGFTTVLTATVTLTPNVSHHIKLVVADTSDSILDSAVFLEAASFVAATPTPTPTNTVSAGATATPTNTPTNTPTVPATATATRTNTPVGPPAVVPTLSFPMLALLAAALVGAAILLMRR
jgi:hypothetical protein